MKTPDFRRMIRRAIKARKMSIPQLARQADCNPQTLYNYLAGRSEIKADLLARAFAALGIKIIA
jgi:transcriptional regulator with XRE-family HTH domain